MRDTWVPTAVLLSLPLGLPLDSGVRGDARYAEGRSRGANSDLISPSLRLPFFAHAFLLLVHRIRCTSAASSVSLYHVLDDEEVDTWLLPRVRDSAQRLGHPPAMIFQACLRNARCSQVPVAGGPRRRVAARHM